MAFLILVNSERLGFSGPRVHLETLFKEFSEESTSKRVSHSFFFYYYLLLLNLTPLLGPSIEYYQVTNWDIRIA